MSGDGEILYHNSFFDFLDFVTGNATAKRAALKQLLSSQDIQRKSIHWASLQKKPRKLGHLDYTGVLQLTASQLDQNREPKLFWQSAFSAIQTAIEAVPAQRKTYQAELFHVIDSLIERKPVAPSEHSRFLEPIVTAALASPIAKEQFVKFFPHLVTRFSDNGLVQFVENCPNVLDRALEVPKLNNRLKDYLDPNTNQPKKESLFKRVVSNLRQKFAEIVSGSDATIQPPLNPKHAEIYAGVYLNNPVGFAEFVRKLEPAKVASLLNQQKAWLQGQHCFYLAPVLAAKFSDKQLPKVLKSLKDGFLFRKASGYLETGFTYDLGAASKVEKPAEQKRSQVVDVQLQNANVAKPESGLKEVAEDYQALLNILGNRQLRGKLNLSAEMMLKLIAKYDYDPELCKLIGSASDFPKKLADLFKKYGSNSDNKKRHESNLKEKAPYLYNCYRAYVDNKVVRAELALSNPAVPPSQALCALMAESKHWETIAPAKEESVLFLFSRKRKKADIDSEKLKRAVQSPYFAKNIFAQTLIEVALDKKPIKVVTVANDKYEICNDNRPAARDFTLSTGFKKALYSKDGYVLLHDTLKGADPEDVLAFIKKYFKVALESNEQKQGNNNSEADNAYLKLMDELALRPRLFNKILELSGQQLATIPQFVNDLVAAVWRLPVKQREKLITDEVRSKLPPLKELEQRQREQIKKEALGKIDLTVLTVHDIQQYLRQVYPGHFIDVAAGEGIKVAHATTEMEFKAQTVDTQTPTVVQATAEIQVAIKNETGEMSVQAGGEQKAMGMQTEVTEKDWAANIDMRTVPLDEVIKRYVANYDADKEAKAWLQNADRAQRLEQLVKISDRYIAKFTAALQKLVAQPVQASKFVVENFAALNDPGALDRLDHLAVNFILGSSEHLVRSLLGRIIELEQQLSSSKQSQHETLEAKASASPLAIELNKLRAVFAACFLRVKPDTVPMDLRGIWPELREVGFAYISNIFAEMPVAERSEMLSTWKQNNVRAFEDLLEKFPVLNTPYVSEEKLVQYIVSVKLHSSLDHLDSAAEIEEQKEFSRDMLVAELQALFQSKSLLTNIINKLRVVLSNDTKVFMQMVVRLFDGEKDDIQDLDALDKMLIDVVVPLEIEAVPELLTALQTEINIADDKSVLALKLFFDRCYKTANSRRKNLDNDAPNSSWKALEEYYHSKILDLTDENELERKRIPDEFLHTARKPVVRRSINDVARISLTPGANGVTPIPEDARSDVGLEPEFSAVIVSPNRAAIPADARSPDQNLVPEDARSPQEQRVPEDAQSPQADVPEDARSPEQQVPMDARSPQNRIPQDAASPEVLFASAGGVKSPQSGSSSRGALTPSKKMNQADGVSASPQPDEVSAVPQQRSPAARKLNYVGRLSMVGVSPFHSSEKDPSSQAGGKQFPPLFQMRIAPKKENAGLDASQQLGDNAGQSVADTLLPTAQR